MLIRKKVAGMKKSFTPPFWKNLTVSEFAKRAGFTLIELLIVLVIIGVVASLTKQGKM